ncbi:MAG: phosphoribosylformylglycinamidine synthase subunit PurL [Planctomycetota bacterium]
MQHLLHTVTVTRARDPIGSTDREVESLLRRETHDPNARAVRDEVYFLRLPVDSTGFDARVERFARQFLAGDPTLEAHWVVGVGHPPRAEDEAALVVMRKAGVMDPVEGSVLHALGDAGYATAECRVRTARRYRLRARGLDRTTLERWARRHLANPVVDDVHVCLPGESEIWGPTFAEAAPGDPGRSPRREVPLTQLDDAALSALARDGGLSLELVEMQAIRAHYLTLGREPTDVELESLAQTWSEHCCHKTFTGPIRYGDERIENLLKETIFAATRELDAPFCLSVFRDNAGVIALDEEWALTFKVETHNHPSALEPYGGAGTGVGGVIRDTLGTGLGARPILNTDVFCFAPLDTAEGSLPPGALHPVRLLSGVVAGVRDYGNRMGIPTANGAIIFHPDFVGNPLVFCGSLGLIPRRAIDKQVRPGDLIVAIGGRTGRDGIHGATFSSRELTEDSETVSAGAVQIGNPIEERKVQDALLRARDLGLYRSVTDCGAGGFSSAVGEMAEATGAEVDLDRAPLKYEGLEPREIWISEAQERMVLAVPPEHRARLFEILAEEEVEGCVLGSFASDGRLILRYRGETVGELSMQFLHGGRPRIERTAVAPTPPAAVAPELRGTPLSRVLRTLLEHPSVASKEPVVRQYDHEVQGRMLTRPFTGVRGDAPSDGVVLDPLRDGRFSVVVGCGIQPYLGARDPYEMGAQSVDEAIRNVVASGGSLARMALLDNFAWGDVRVPEILGAAIECARGAADAARAYGAPFISGKDSLYNTYRVGDRSRSIPHTLLVSAVSVVEGAPRCPATDAKHRDARLVLVGPAPGLGGSMAEFLFGGAGGDVARFDAALGPRLVKQLVEWMRCGWIASCHDLSEGGLAVAVAELGFGGDGVGVDVDLSALAGDDPPRDAGTDDFVALFGEGPHRFLLEVVEEHVPALLACRPGLPIAAVGRTDGSGRIRVRRGAKLLIDEAADELREVWKRPFQEWRDGRIDSAAARGGETR